MSYLLVIILAFGCATQPSSSEPTPAEIKEASLKWFHIYESGYQEGLKAEAPTPPAADKAEKLDKMISEVIARADWLLGQKFEMAGTTYQLNDSRFPASESAGTMIKRTYLKVGPFYCSAIAYTTGRKANSSIVCFDDSGNPGQEAVMSY